MQHTFFLLSTDDQIRLTILKIHPPAQGGVTKREINCEMRARDSLQRVGTLQHSK